MSNSPSSDYSNDFAFWWKAEQELGEGSEIAQTAWGFAEQIRTADTFRRNVNREFIRQFGDPRYCGMGLMGLRSNSPNILDELSSQENVIREQIWTLQNKLAKSKPVPTIVTEGAVGDEQFQARERERFVRGVLEEDKYYSLLDRCENVRMLVGDGFIKVVDDYDKGRPRLEWVPTWELLVDPADGHRGTPRSLVQVTTEQKEVLCARFPKFEEEIMRTSTTADESFLFNYFYNSRHVAQYLEAWHLPSSEDAGDGLHIIALPGVALLVEEWEEPTFPVARLPWMPKPFGFWSTGLVEDLLPPQRMLNRNRAAIDTHFRLHSAAFWALEKGSKVMPSQLSNQIGRIIEYIGKPPELMTPAAVSPQLFEREDRIKAQVHAQTGLSPYATQNQIPASLSGSGKSQRVYADQQDQRFVMAYQSREECTVDVCKLVSRSAQRMLDTAKKRDPGQQKKIQARITDGRRIDTVSWTSADLDSFTWKVLPASSLSTTLEGKIADIADLTNLGMITNQDQKRKLLQMPDLESEDDFDLAPRQLIAHVLQQKILKDGENVTPEPLWDLQTCLDLGVKTYCYAQLHEYDEERLQILRNWIAECQARLNPPPDSAPPAIPPGPGIPPPVPPSPEAPPPEAMPGALPQVPPPIPGGAPIPGGPMPGAMA